MDYFIPDNCKDITINYGLGTVGGLTFTTEDSNVVAACKGNKWIFYKIYLGTPREHVTKWRFSKYSSKVINLTTGKKMYTVVCKGISSIMEDIVCYPGDMEKSTLKVMEGQPTKGYYKLGLSTSVYSNIDLTSVKGVYNKAIYDRKHMRSKVGTIMNSLFLEKAKRDNIHGGAFTEIKVIGLGSHDASGQPWMDFSNGIDDGFRIPIGDSMMDVYNQLRDMGLTVAVERGNVLELYDATKINSSLALKGVSFSGNYLKLIESIEESEDSSNYSEAFLVVDKNIYTSCRPDGGSGQFEPEKVLHVDISDDANVHWKIASLLLQENQKKASISGFITNNTPFKPILDFHVGNSISVQGVITGMIIESMTLKIMSSGNIAFDIQACQTVYKPTLTGGINLKRAIAKVQNQNTSNNIFSPPKECVLNADSLMLTTENGGKLNVKYILDSKGEVAGWYYPDFQKESEAIMIGELT